MFKGNSIDSSISSIEFCWETIEIASVVEGDAGLPIRFFVKSQDPTGTMNLNARYFLKILPVIASLVLHILWLFLPFLILV